MIGRLVTGRRRHGACAAGAVLGVAGGAVLLAMLAMATGAVAQNERWLIVPGERVGPVTADASAEGLRAALGEVLVVDVTIDLGEGESAPGTLVYPDDPTLTLAIQWRDAERRERPARIYICYPRNGWLADEGCRWRTAEGIGIGTHLSELEALNGDPFLLTGFEWDYSGTVVSWQGGALEQALAPAGWRTWVRLLPGSDEDGDYVPALTIDEMRQVSGDRDLSSTHPVMRKLDPAIYSLGVIIDR